MAAISITADNVLVDSSTVTPVIDQSHYLGAALTAGVPVYIDTADSNSLKAGDASAEATADLYGILLNGGGDGQPADVLRRGVVTIGGTVAVGTSYAVGPTAGEIVPETDLATGEYYSSCGKGISTTQLVVDFTSPLNSTGATHA